MKYLAFIQTLSGQPGNFINIGMDLVQFMSQEETHYEFEVEMRKTILE
jgi:hypothetical protein